MVRHVLGISGGKDSAALAIYMKSKYPDLKIEYYNSDTGCELEETELLINRLESYLGGIIRLRAAEGSPEPTPFEHFLKASGNFLPSPQQRWCTKKMKLAEMERFVGDLPTISYVGRTGRAMCQRNRIFKQFSPLGKIFGASMLFIRLYIRIISDVSRKSILGWPPTISKNSS